MKIKLRAFGIAKDIINTSILDLELEEKASISDVKNRLIEKYPDFSKLKSLRFAVNEDYQSDSFTLENNDEIVIIPPVSGG
mgnify:CR=1 FL=1